jgi:hypothetical protein
MIGVFQPRRQLWYVMEASLRLKDRLGSTYNVCDSYERGIWSSPNLSEAYLAVETEFYPSVQGKLVIFWQ